MGFVGWHAIIRKLLYDVSVFGVVLSSLDRSEVGLCRTNWPHCFTMNRTWRVASRKEELLDSSGIPWRGLCECLMMIVRIK